MSQMLSEMAEQPTLLEESAALLYEQAKNAAPSQRPRLIVFAARGSSDNACIYAKYLFEVILGIPTCLAAPSVVTRYHGKLKYEDALLIGVSQSAAAPDVAAVLSSGNNPSISITNVESGPVVSAARSHIFLEAGEEKAVAATKTFTLTMLAFYQLCRAMGGDLPAPNLREPSQAALDNEDAQKHAREIVASELVLSLGRGYHFGVALEAALKLMECALVPCKPYSFADFAHGPMALAGEGVCAIAFGRDASDETSSSVRESLLGKGAGLIQTPTADLPEPLQPIPAAIFAQRLAYEASVLRGLDPDSPPHLSKVTRTR